MKILITGACGFIGRQLIAERLRKVHQAVDRDAGALVAELRRARQPLLRHARRGLRILLREGRFLLELLDAPLVGPRLLVVVQCFLVHEVPRGLDAVELAAARQVVVEVVEGGDGGGGSDRRRSR